MRKGGRKEGSIPPSVIDNAVINKSSVVLSVRCKKTCLVYFISGKVKEGRKD